MGRTILENSLWPFPFDILRMKTIGFVCVIHISVACALRFQTEEIPERWHCNLARLLALYG